MSKIIYLDNLEEFESKIQNNNIDNKKNTSTSIAYIEGDKQDYIIIDEDKIFYAKVPELAVSRQLYAMELLEVINHKYIPIYNKKTNLLFTKFDYENLVKRMSGLKSYDMGNYISSDNLYFNGLDKYLEKIDSNFEQISKRREPIVKEFMRIMSSIGLNTTLGCNSGGDIELVEAGSTIRGTNIPMEENNKWDFDFTVRMDADKVWVVKDALEKQFKAQGHITLTSRYKVRLTDVTIPGLDKPIDLDFSLTPQKEKYLSTEDAISERLENLKEQDVEKYKLVLANIMYAKDYLKSRGVYKPSRGILDGDRSFGGLGGVGIENWILQNGGSFIDATNEFLEHTKQAETNDGKDFIEFQKKYAIMDFGKNHVSVSKHIFPYDNFIMKNMRYNGYQKMVDSLNEFLYSKQQARTK